jgi:hypothetical protein
MPVPELEQLEQLLFGLIGLIVLIIIGLIVYLVLATRKQRSIKASAELDARIPLPASRVAGQILSLVRDEEGMPLQVEIEGTRYRHMADVQEPQFRRQVIEAALDLIRFTGALGQEVNAPASLEQTYRWREDIREGSQAELEHIQTLPISAAGQPTPSIAPEEVEERFLNLLAEMGQTPPAVEKPTLVGSVQQRLRPKSRESEQSRTDAGRSFVDDIEAILQRRIQLIPALQGRGLHVHSGTGGKVCFVFEGQEYDNVESLPNLTARRLVQDAIQEWDETT